MVKVIDKIRLFKNDKCVEVEALFDTGAGKSYVSKRVAEVLGYERYEKPREVQLAVKNFKAKVIGYLVAHVEIAGYVLPEVEVFGVIEDLVRDVIIGLNIIEPYEIVLERDRVRFKRIPPTTLLA